MLVQFRNIYFFLILSLFLTSPLQSQTKGTCQPEFSLDQYLEKQDLKETKKNPVFVFF